MPNLLEGLVIDRVDLVDEGCNSAAFIELYKRKEQSAIMTVEEILSKMKPEHSAAIKAELDKLSKSASDATEALETLKAEHTEAEQELTKAKSDLATVNEELTKATSELETLKVSKAKECTCDGEADENGVCKVCGKVKKAEFDEEEVLKSMPESAKVLFTKMRAQKEAAEEEVRKAKEAEKTAEAIAKAAELKALPIDNEKLVGIIKNCSKDMVDVLTTINAAIEGTVLDEVGKSTQGVAGSDAWAKIEIKAESIAKRDNVTKQKAVSIAIKENPELYKEYLQGGAN